ncbi:MAG: endonuclease/exonuclease/phosphatase family protein, partial [Cellvibrio sp.]
SSKNQTVIFILFFGALFSLSVFAAPAYVDVKVMTFNVRVPVDPHPNDWASRKPLVFAGIKDQAPDFLGVQEALPEVLADINSEFTKYAQVGRGRNQDGGGEGTQIFYKKSDWLIDPTDQGTFQLSPTPDVPGSNGWQMQFPRIFTWARFIEKKSGNAIYVFNTHFPLTPQERNLSVKLLAKHIAERKWKNEPVILTGDLNAVESEDSIKYISGEGGSPISMKDAYRSLYPDKTVGTFHGFGKEKDARKVDYIFFQGEAKVLSAEILENKEADQNYASDHYPVVAKIRLIGKK